MKAGPKGIYIGGDNEEGVFYAVQTLIQLLPVERQQALDVPYLEINDEPRFGYRGMHLDAARHFMPVDFIKKYIDYLALHKLNTFHWHLTDDQGWRLEIKKYPKLTEVGAWRNGSLVGRYPGNGNDNEHYGGYYTQEQVKDIVAYAAARYITVIPEIELPGHCSAAIAAYPQLSCFPDEPTVIPQGMASRLSLHLQASGQKKLVQETWGTFEDVFCPSEYTFQFLQDVFDEVMSLFPSRYIHIGGDECPKAAWKRSAFCQQLIREKNLQDEKGLQSYFIRRIEKYLNTKGRRIIGWDEILEGGLAPDATVMSWRGEKGGIEAAKLGHQVIMTPGNPLYFDHKQSLIEDSVTFGGYNPVELVYAYEPVTGKLNADEAKYVLGAQANVWTEYITNTSKVEYMIFPRMAALSEVLWSPKEKRDPADFEKRLPQQFKRYKLWKANFSKAYYDLKPSILPGLQHNSVRWKLESKQQDALIEYGLEHSPVFQQYREPVEVSQSGVYLAKLHLGKEINTEIRQQFFFNSATGKQITLATEPSKNYPGDGAFTLVNAVQNEKGLANATEFLGFSGTNLDATIDLGRQTTVTRIAIHTFSQPVSWIYPPTEIAVSFLNQLDAPAVPGQVQPETIIYKVTNDDKLQVVFLPQPKSCRYLKVVVKNYGTIPADKPGAGEKAWLFVDEIEVN